MTTENNKIIAEFLGLEIDKETQNYLVPIKLAKIGDFKEWADTKHINEIGYYLLSENQLCFDFDWNWLMEVVEKISKGKIYSESKEYRNFCLLKITDNIEQVYFTCVEFIKWYNENK